MNLKELQKMALPSLSTVQVCRDLGCSRTQWYEWLSIERFRDVPEGPRLSLSAIHVLGIVKFNRFASSLDKPYKPVELINCMTAGGVTKSDLLKIFDLALRG